MNIFVGSSPNYQNYQTTARYTCKATNMLPGCWFDILICSSSFQDIYAQRDDCCGML